MIDLTIVFFAAYASSFGHAEQATVMNLLVLKGESEGDSLAMFPKQCHATPMMIPTFTPPLPP